MTTRQGPSPGRPRVRPYAASGPRRTAQVAADSLVLTWVATCTWAGTQVHGAVAALAAPGRDIADGAGGLASRLRDAGGSAAGLPLLGDVLGDPLAEAGGAADRVAGAGDAFAAGVQDVALLLGLLVGLLPALLVVAVWLPVRVRFARRAAAAQHLVAGGTDLQLFALRALAHQPLPALARVDHDPVGAWRRGDVEVLRRLAALELRDVGVDVSRLPGGPERPPAVGGSA